MINARKSNILIKVLIIVILSYVTVISNVSQAAIMPEYDRLQPITDGLDSPTAVALDHAGNVFVPESLNNRVLIYSQSGQYVNTLSGLNRPISVALDSNGRLFVGNKDSGNVEVYAADLTLLFKLGTGDGEFTQPGSIAIDSGGGKVYVADSEENRIKVYNTDGSYNFTFGSTGNGNGEFNFPTSIAIDNKSGELIISDLQTTYDMFGEEIEGARIQVFDLNGAYKRSFGDYGVGEGLINKPIGVAVDQESRIYVTDSFQNVVHVYDNSGTFLGTVFDLGNPMRTPLGITMGNSNRLYIASLTQKRIEVYGIAPYTLMGVSPLSLRYEGLEGSSPALQTVEISNNGTGVLNWTAGTEENWITLSETTGTAEPAALSVLEVGVNLNGLAPGTYTGNVSISAESGVTEIVTVELTVLPTPVLSVSPSLLGFTSLNGSIPSPQSLSIENVVEGTLEWTASSDSSWILISKDSGFAPDTIDVSVDIASKGVGTYTGAITVAAEGALSGPAVIPVTLFVIEQKGTINVSTNLAEATFIINGAVSFQGSGTGWGVTDAPTGTYAIVFGNVAGYTTPSSQSLTLEADGIITFTGEYTSEENEQPVNRYIIAGAGPGKRNEGIVKVFDSKGIETGISFIAHEHTYGVNVAAGDINSDGVDEIITAPGPGAENPAEVRIFDREGNELTNLRITAYQYNYGANIESGDFDGDGHYEVVTGAGGGAENPAEVKVFVYEEKDQKMVDSGISLIAYGGAYGVRVAAGDIDGDGVDEIITAPGPDPLNSGIVRIWEVDTSSGVGQWSTTKLKDITVTSRYSYSVSVAGGDINGDGNDEVVTGEGPHHRAGDVIRIFDGGGDEILRFRSYLYRRYGTSVASGDLDRDGAAEIVVGAGPYISNRAIIKVFDANGSEQVRFRALNTRYGVNVTIGDLGLVP